jgi:uncharacterized protein (TIRG00374 family)
VLGSALALGLLGLVFWGLDLRAIGAALLRAHPAWLVACVLMTLLSYWLRAWRWRSLLAPLLPVPVAELHRATLVGFSASLVLPRSGELLRPWLVAQRHPVAATAAFATIVVERLLDLFCVLAMFALYLFVLPRPAMETAGRWIDGLQAAGAAAAVLAAVLMALLIFMHAYTEAAGQRLRGVVQWLPAWLADRLARIARGFAGGLAVMRSPWPHHAWIAWQSAWLWLATIAGYHMVHLAFGLALPFQVTLLLVAFLVVGESIPTPGLIGGFHAFYMLALTEVYGVQRETAVAVAIAAHALTNLPILLAGAWLVARGGVSFSKLRSGAELSVAQRQAGAHRDR